MAESRVPSSVRDRDRKRRYELVFSIVADAETNRVQGVVFAMILLCCLGSRTNEIQIDANAVRVPGS